MKMTFLFNKTLHETPNKGHTSGLHFLIRAGYLHPVSSGGFAYLPFGAKSIRKMQETLRQSLQQDSIQEVYLPTGSLADIALRKIISRNIQSYRQLPRQFYCAHFDRTNNLKVPGGIFNQTVSNRCALFCLSSSPQEMQKQTGQQANLLESVLQQWKLPFLMVPDGVNLSEGVEVSELFYPAESGDQMILSCPSCGYRANRPSARFSRGNHGSESLLPVEEVHTPGAHTIQALAGYLDIPISKTAKAVLLMALSSTDLQLQSTPAEEFIFAIIRGDLDVDEGKLARLLGVESLRPATEAEIRAAGAEPGYASPIGLKNIRIIVDESIPLAHNLVTGANRPDYHLRNINYGRDYTAWKTADIALAAEGAPCPQCQSSLTLQHGILLGCLEKWSRLPDGAQPITYLDSTGKPRPVCMASCWLDLDAVLACSAQEHHDEKGLLLPVNLAPFAVYMVVINSKDGASELAAEKIYQNLINAGLEALLDDRPERPGVKFNDADLIGPPLRITVSERNLLENMVEVKQRDKKEPVPVPMDRLQSYIIATLKG